LVLAPVLGGPWCLSEPFVVSSDALLGLGTTVFAGALWGVAAFKFRSSLAVAIFFEGLHGPGDHVLDDTVMQNLAPDWVAARVHGCVHARLHGNVTAGSAFWGNRGLARLHTISMITRRLARRLSNIEF